MKLKLPIPVVSFIASWWKLAVGLAVGAAFGVLIGQWQGAKAAKAHEEADRAVAITEAVTTNAGANEKSAEQQMADAKATAEIKEQLTDATANLPDNAPSVRRVRRACVELRQDGADISGLAACRGIEGGPPAEANAGSPNL